MQDDKDEFKSMKEMTERAFLEKTPEDEAFDEIEKAQGWRKRQIAMLNDSEEAFMAWSEHSHHPQHFHIERKAFCAGWAAAMQQRWKEIND